jgi:hypothetical protein
MSLDELFDAVDKAEERKSSGRYFGQLAVDLWFCILRKGEGKILFDPAQHRAEERRTAIDLTLAPLATAHFRNEIKRSIIAESNDWVKILRPSLLACNVDLRNLNDRFVQIEMVSTRTYKDANGVEKTATTPKVVAVYADESACETAAAAFYSETALNSLAKGNGHPPEYANATPQNDGERAVALQFLAGMWQASGKDRTKFLTASTK